MTTFEPQVVGDPSPNPESNSATIAVLSTEIETLTAAKNAIEITPAKAAFESTIAILTLVRVRISVLLPFLHLLKLVTGPGRDDKRRCARGIGQILCQSVPRVEGRDPRQGCEWSERFESEGNRGFETVRKSSPSLAVDDDEWYQNHTQH